MRARTPPFGLGGKTDPGPGFKGVAPANGKAAVFRP
jgi:hypothetical protein